MTTGNLRVSEVFYSIQGEGKTSGTPSLFIRLPGCNLLCKSESWTCDTIDVWKRSQLMPRQEILDLVNKYGIQNTIITGGEPLLQQKLIAEIMDMLPIQMEYEVETNGTVMPGFDLIPAVNQWNISPKLLNSGEPKGKRFFPNVITALQATGNAIFKFVISGKDDIEEIRQDYNMIESKYIWLMPACDSRSKFTVFAPLVAEWCKEYGYKFSPRLQLVIWDKTTGV